MGLTSHVAWLYVGAKRFSVGGVFLLLASQSHHHHPSQTHEIRKNIFSPFLTAYSPFPPTSTSTIPPQFLNFSLQTSTEEVSLPFLCLYLLLTINNRDLLPPTPAIIFSSTPSPVVDISSSRNFTKSFHETLTTFTHICNHGSIINPRFPSHGSQP